MIEGWRIMVERLDQSRTTIAAETHLPHMPIDERQSHSVYRCYDHHGLQ
ncbi:hypothetical protein QD460_31370 [Rhizobium jaguaris]